MKKGYGFHKRVNFFFKKVDPFLKRRTIHKVPKYSKDPSNTCIIIEKGTLE